MAASNLTIRNWLLVQTDWTQLPDNDLTTEERDAWATYRQALRDIKQDTINFKWPVPPQKINFDIDNIPWWLVATVQREINL